MQIIDVTSTLDGIELFPKDELTEILQNVRTIITTVKGTVPLDRDFGVDASIIDMPLTVARPLIIKEVKEAIERYEPRAKFIEMMWNGNYGEGIMTPTVKVAIRT